MPTRLPLLPAYTSLNPHIGSISALHRHHRRACPLRGYGRAGREAVILSTGTPIPAQRTCRRRCRYRAETSPCATPSSTRRAAERRWRARSSRACAPRAGYRLYIGSISASPTACPLRGYGRADTQNDRLSVRGYGRAGTQMTASEQVPKMTASPRRSF